jgi:hypothetical protein
VGGGGIDFEEGRSGDLCPGGCHTGILQSGGGVLEGGALPNLYDENPKKHIYYPKNRMAL